MTEKLHVQDRQLRELMFQMSHDLRNPLAAIVTNLEFAKRLIRTADMDQDLVDSIDDSVTACDVLRRIVSNLDVLVRGNALAVTLHEVDIGASVNEVITQCQGRVAQAGLTVGFARPAGAVRAMLDRGLFALAVENMVENSIQHAPRRSSITVEVQVEASLARVRVKDEGPTVPQELREMAVSAHGHTPTGKKESARYSRGLGLLAANAAACATGCTLQLNEEGQRSVLMLEVPVIPA